MARFISLDEILHKGKFAPKKADDKKKINVKKAEIKKEDPVIEKEDTEHVNVPVVDVEDKREIVTDAPNIGTDAPEETVVTDAPTEEEAPTPLDETPAEGDTPAEETVVTDAPTEEEAPAPLDETPTEEEAPKPKAKRSKKSKE